MTNERVGDWIDVGHVRDMPERGARVVRAPFGDIAIFRTADGEVFALRDRCPHKGGPLSQGIVHGRAVTCPLHNWVIDLDDRRGAGRRRRLRRQRAVADRVAGASCWQRRHCESAPREHRPVGGRGSHDLPLLRRRLRRHRDAAARRQRRDRRRSRSSGQFRPALLEGRRARARRWRSTAGCCIPRSTGSARAGTRRSTLVAAPLRARSSPSMAPTRWRSTSPASC